MKNLILPLLLVLSIFVTAQDEYSYSELIEKGFYAEAESKISKIKKKDFIDNKALVIALYKQWKYQAAYDAIKVIDSEKVKSDKELNVLLIDLERTQSNYEKLKTDYFLSENILINWIEWPMNHLNKEKMILEKTNLLLEGERFMGATRFSNELWLARKNTETEMSQEFYRLEKALITGNIIEGNWKELRNEKIKNTIFEASPSSDSKGNLYFSKCTINASEVKVKKKNKDKKTLNYLNIYFSDKDHLNASIPFEGAISFKNCNTTHPYMYNDSILFFVSDKLELGNMDLYYSILQNGKWKEGERIEISSNLNDAFPVAKNGVLYFSSKGFENYGGFDVFQTFFAMKNGKLSFTKVQNMLLPFNSSADDMMVLLESDTKGMLASNRGTDIQDVIYSFELQQSDLITTTLLNNLTKDKVSGKLKMYSKAPDGEWIFVDEKISNDLNLINDIEVNKRLEYKLHYSASGFRDTIMYLAAIPNPDRDIQLKALENIYLTESIVRGHVADRITQNSLDAVHVTITSTDKEGNKSTTYTSSDKLGEWELNYNPETDYEIEFSKPGYDPYIVLIASESDLEDLNMVYLNQKSKKGGKISVPNIYYDYNSAALQARSLPILDNVVSFMLERPTLCIELGAHTDAKGKDKDNMTLSQKRALSCYNYLISKGINPKRLTYKGYGETQLVNKCDNNSFCTNEENEINRRVELKVTKE